MKKLSNVLLIKIFTNLLVLLVVAKVISLAVWWFLPSDGVELQVKENHLMPYKKIDFHAMIISPTAAKAKVVASQEKKPPQSGVTHILLKGFYGKGEVGMAILALKAIPNDTSVVSVGEEFKGYILKSIVDDGIIFLKDSIEYPLLITKEKDTLSSRIVPVTTEEVTKSIARQSINDYVENKKNIWKEIAFETLKDGEQIKGFKIKNMSSNSQIASFGLAKGDVIIAANNTPLKSLKDVLDIYSNISKISTLQLTFLRDNQEQEIVIEIQ